MVIKNKPTFDPYSLTDFQVGDAFRSAWKTWAAYKWLCLAISVVTLAPVVFVQMVFSDRFLTMIASGVMIPNTITLISPLIARDARGLRTDFRVIGRIMRDRIVGATLIGLLISSLVAAPALVMLSFGSWATIFGLVLGALGASPLALALPITITESVGMLQGIRRSLFLIKGRMVAALCITFACISIASCGTAVRFLVPELVVWSFVPEPIFVSLAGVGIGALYLHLYDR